MPWTTPVTWSNSAVVGATDLNEQVRDNMAFLFSPTFSMIVTGHTGVSTFNTTSTTAVPLTAGISSVVTTYGGALNIFFRAHKTGVGTAVFNLEYNGTAYTMLPSGLATAFQHAEVWYNVWLTGLTSGTHVFMPTWFTLGGPAAIETSGFPLIFWVREG